MFLSTWRSQTDSELLHSFHTGWGTRVGVRLLYSPTGNVDSRVSGREKRLVGWVRRWRLLVAVRHLKVISGLPHPGITH